MFCSFLSHVEEGSKPDAEASSESLDDGTKTKADFQSQFLEFSQRRQQSLGTSDSAAKATVSAQGAEAEGDKDDDKDSVGHIAALLQVGEASLCIIVLFVSHNECVVVQL
jgi:hypothetical protein